MRPRPQLIIHDMVPRDELASAIPSQCDEPVFWRFSWGPAIGGGLMVLLGPAWGLLANVLIYVPFSVFVRRAPYTGTQRSPWACTLLELERRDAHRVRGRTGPADHHDDDPGRSLVVLCR